MRRKLLKLAAMFALGILSGIAFGQTTATYTGTIKDLGNNVVTSGQVTFTLAPSNDSTIPGTGRFTPSTITCNIQPDGTLQSQSGGACTVTKNSALSPNGTSYRICIQPYFATPGSCFFDYAITDSKDISTIAPTLSTGPVNYGGIPGPPGTASVSTANGTSGSFVIPAHLTSGNATLLTTVSDPVLGSVPTQTIAKGSTSDATTYPSAILDSTGRPVASFDGAGRLNLDGYQPGGPVIDLRNWNTLSSGDLIGHYAFGMKTDSNQAITSGGVFHVMNTSTQANVNTQVLVEWNKALNASACPSFCQPNSKVTFGPTDVGIFDVPLNFYNSATNGEIQAQIGHVLQLRPRGAGDGFTFPNNSNTWLHVDASKNIRFINDGTQASIQSVNDAGNSFQPLGVNASTINLNAPVSISNSLSVLGGIGGQVNQAVTVKPVGTGSTDFSVQNFAGTINNFLVNENASITLHPAAFSTYGSCSAGTEGSIAAVTDSSVNTFGTVVTGGGSNHIKMYCNGTSWVVN